MHRQQTEARITGKLGRLFQVLSIALLTSCWATTNAQVVTTGSETLVNTTTANSQQNPAVAMDTAGNYIVVWESFEEDGDDYGIYGQLYDAGGTPNGSQIEISPYDTDGQRLPDVDMADNGDFVVVWMSDDEDGDGQGIYARRYNSDGSPKATDFRVNSGSADEQTLPQVAVAGTSGDMVFTWVDEVDDGDQQGIYARQYLSNGAATSAPYLVNTTTTGYQGHPVISMNSDGDHVIAWQGVDADGMGIFAQMYDNGSSPNTIGGEIAVNATTTANQQEPSIAMDPSGNFIITWSSYAQDGDHHGIYAQIYDNAGSVTVAEFVVNTTTANSQNHSHSTATEDGLFYVSWTSWAQDGDKAGVYIQGFKADGNLYGTEQRVNTRTNDFQQFGDVAAVSETKELVVVWQDGLRNSTSTHDGGDYGVYMQRHDINDVTPPNAVCQNITVFLDGAGNVTITAADVDGGSTDDCGAVTLSVNTTSFVCADIGSNAVILTVTDGSGNTANCGATVTVVDTVSPVVTCQNITVYLDGTGNASITDTDIDNGSTDNCGIASYSASLTAFTCTDLGTNNVTLTVSDASGNTSSCVSVVTVLDTVSPTVSCPGNQTENADASCQATLSDYTGLGSTGDNCSATITQSPPSGTTITATTTVTLTSTDGSGNTAECTFDVSIIDATAPSIACPGNQTENGDASCQATLSDYTGLATVADNCDASPVVTQSPASGTTINSTTTVTLTVTDATGNSADCTFDVSITDNTAPSIACPGNQTENADAVCDATLSDYTGLATVADNCDASPVVTQSPSAGTTISATTTVTLTVTDASGNTSDCTFDVSIIDNTAPTITCPSNQTENGDASCQATLSDYTGLATVGDNCDASPTVTQSPASGTTISATTTVTLTVTDASGNSADCTFDVSINDNTAPTIACPGNQTENADAVCDATLSDYTGLATVADNCDASPVVTQSPSAGTTISATTTVTLTVTDASGNTADCTFDVSIIDNTAPTIACPSNQTENGDASCQATLSDYTGLATVADNCDASPTVTQSPASGTTFSATTTVTLTVTDASGNSSDCTFDVSIIDNTAPTITCPGNQTENADAVCDATLSDYTGLATVADNCDASPVVTQSPSAGTTISATTTVTLTVTDASGNTTDCTFDVSIIDATGPTVTCPGSQVENFNASCQFTLPDYTSLVTVTDNCDASPTLVQSPIAGTVITGNTTITVTATDASGNTSDCTFDVVPNDATPPIITCPGNQAGTADATCLFTLPDYTGMATATDNCGTPFITQSPAIGSQIGLGTTTITLTASDGVNSANCTFDVDVTDVTAPTITCPANTNENADANCDVSLPDYTASATVADNCDASPVVTQSPAAGTILNGAGTIQTVTLTVTDASGNTADCTFDVTVVDATAPTITCPINQTGTADASCQFSLADYTGMATVADNCDAAPVVTQSPAAGTMVNMGTTIVTLTVTDASGNTADCTFDVDVADNTAPTITCPANTSEIADANCDLSLPDYTTSATVADNCDASPVVTQSPTAGTTISGAGTVQTVTLTVTDASGNTADCTFDVTVVDTLAPTITCPANDTVTADANCEALLADYTGLATTADNCDASPVVTQSPTAGSTITGTTTVTLTATDASGNTADCMFDVVVEDTTAPVINCPINQSEAADANCEGVLSDYTVMATVFATDNCDPNPVITQSPSVGTTFTGIMTVTLTATDASGNTADCTFDVDVVDMTGPTVICPGNDTISTDPTCQFVLADYTGLATATDNCDPNPVIVSQNPTAGFVGSGNTDVYIIAMDASGNLDSCMFTVVVTDTVAPTITCPSDTILLCDSVFTYGMPLANDNCSGVVVTQTDATGLTSGSAFPFGTTTIEFTATDGAGNTAMCTYDVTVLAPSDASFTYIATGPGTFDFTPNTQDANNTYSWDFGDTNTDNNMLTNHTYATAGVFTVCLTVTDTNACMVTYCDSVTSSVGIDENGVLTNFNLYPNPAGSGVVYLDITNIEKDASELYIEITDVQGKLILREKVQLGGSRLVKELQLQDLSSGVYNVRMRISDLLETKRLIITR
jgi:beta-lactam-binding protein with PASTA domain